MGYAWDIDIPANTLAKDPVTQKLKLHPGIITKIECKFPAGCHSMVGVRLYRGGVFQVFPLSAGEWVTGDDEPVSFNYYFDLTDHPRELIFEGHSAGSTYEHTVTIRITVLPRAVASMIPLMEIFTRIARRMGLVR